MSSVSEASGLGRIESIFASKGEGVLMPFVCGGHPTPSSLGGVLAGLEAGGAGIIEVGFPFSDPIADGPVIASAMGRAIEQGVTPRSLIAAVGELRGGLSVGLVAMVSVSIVHRLGGAEAFVSLASDAGFDGFIFPDAPVEESDDLIAAAEKHGRSVSLLISPTTPDERAREIARRCRGFVYTLARTGITGERSDAPDVADRVATLRSATNTPIAVGFGIGTRSHVRAVFEHADAAIVGSALVRRLESASDPAGEARSFAASLLTD